MADIDLTKYPALATWLTAEPERRSIRERPGRFKGCIAIELLEDGKPKYGFEDPCRDRILASLNYCMHNRLMREVPTNAPGSGRVTS